MSGTQFAIEETGRPACSLSLLLLLFHLPFLLLLLSVFFLICFFFSRTRATIEEYGRPFLSLSLYQSIHYLFYIALSSLFPSLSLCSLVFFSSRTRVTIEEYGRPLRARVRRVCWHGVVNRFSLFFDLLLDTEEGGDDIADEGTTSTTAPAAAESIRTKSQDQTQDSISSSSSSASPASSLSALSSLSAIKYTVEREFGITATLGGFHVTLGYLLRTGHEEEVRAAVTALENIIAQCKDKVIAFAKPRLSFSLDAGTYGQF